MILNLSRLVQKLSLPFENTFESIGSNWYAVFLLAVRGIG